MKYIVMLGCDMMQQKVDFTKIFGKTIIYKIGQKTTQYIVNIKYKNKKLILYNINNEDYYQILAQYNTDNDKSIYCLITSADGILNLKCSIIVNSKQICLDNITILQRVQRRNIVRIPYQALIKYHVLFNINNTDINKIIQEYVANDKIQNDKAISLDISATGIAIFTAEKFDKNAVIAITLFDYLSNKDLILFGEIVYSIPTKQKINDKIVSGFKTGINLNISSIDDKSKLNKLFSDIQIQYIKKKKLFKNL